METEGQLAIGRRYDVDPSPRCIILPLSMRDLRRGLMQGLRLCRIASSRLHDTVNIEDQPGDCRCGRGSWCLLLRLNGPYLGFLKIGALRLAYTGPRLISHDSIIGHHRHDDRSIWYPRQFIRCLRLHLPAILHDRRTNALPTRFKTHRRAAGQPARRDYEDGEPPLPASFVVLHWLSPWLRDVPRAAPFALQRGGSTAGTAGW